eukprot:MONOS_15364.1-p1 / transcript=MONOS_15364.1 / gene=MONOS_15364 / organism=Monocercomonoides_exilis_PA203 / gene_product=IQ calmodulin-binding motif family protein / transcript_product=IQ calmodulin-binding motif family protein / location=Mono_scaffold01209:11776-13354(+) / protein_length=484 / sequence_SO=supercontig / SO=protein_coding / is_pseudo=false
MQDKKLFGFYRDLINFHEQGDPVQIIRGLNPIEAELIDPAVSGCVRFRLGGETFPPMIYYKIFIRASLCDVNSFAPRDYTRPFRQSRKMNGAEKESKRPRFMRANICDNKNENKSHFSKGSSSEGSMPFDFRGTDIQDNRRLTSSMFSTSSTSSVSSVSSVRTLATISKSIDDSQLEGLNEKDVEGWYVRDDWTENNWRAINERGYKQMISMAPNWLLDESGWGSSTTRIAMYHSPFGRFKLERHGKPMTKAEREKQKRAKAIKWMRAAAKMDRDLDEMIAEMEGINEEDNKTESEEFEGKEGEGEESEQMEKKNKKKGNLNLDELVQWSRELDYGAYLDEWSHIGTSERSDAALVRKAEMKKMKEMLMKRLEGIGEENKERFTFDGDPSANTHESEAKSDQTYSFEEGRFHESNTVGYGSDDEEGKVMRNEMKGGGEMKSGRGIGGSGGRAGFDYDSNDNLDGIFDAMDRGWEEDIIGEMRKE